MTEIGDDKLQDYIDGRLGDQDEAAIAAHLLANPEQADYVQRLREQNKVLKGVGAGILSEPVPERLKAVLDTAREQHRDRHLIRVRRGGFFSGLAYAGAMAAGLAIGWFAHANYYTGPSPAELALIAGSEAYSFYSRDNEFGVDFGSGNDVDLGKWMQEAFGREVARPDLDDLGYTYVGSRLLPWSGGRMAMQLFENDQGGRAAVLIWPSDEPPHNASEFADLGNVRTTYRWKDGLTYAVMGDRSNKDFDKVANAVIDRFSPPDM